MGPTYVHTLLLIPSQTIEYKESIVEVSLLNPSSGKAPFMSSSLHDRILEKCFESFFTVLITFSTFGHALLSRTLSLSSFLQLLLLCFMPFATRFHSPTWRTSKCLLTILPLPSSLVTLLQKLFS